MLNTIMALWNRHHGKNRQRIVKMVFTILFISVSVSLFLFTLNSSAWSPFAGAQGQKAKREEPPTMSNAREIVIAGNTPIDDSGTAGIRPTATKVTIQPSCVQAPGVVVQQRVTIRPQNVVTYSGRSGLIKEGGERKHAQPKTIRVKKGKPHSNRPEVKVIAPPGSQATETVPVVPPVILPIVTPTIQQTTIPGATAEVVTTTTPADGTADSNVPTDGTADSNVPAIVTSSDTPDTSATSTTQFTSSLRQKGTLPTSVAPLVKNGKKSSDKKNDNVHGNVECSRSTAHKDSSGGIAPRAGKHAGLLLGSSLLEVLLLYCFTFVFKREE